MNDNKKERLNPGLKEIGNGSTNKKDFRKGKKGWNSHNKKSNMRGLGKGKDFNDISFYTKNPSITEAFAKLPFNHIIGQPLRNTPFGSHFTSVASFIVDWCASSKDTAEMARSEYIQVENIKSDILNQVATIIYTTMRRSNSGATNDIEAVDVVTSNLLASIDILANAVAMKRTFAIANSFSWKNRTVPEVLFQHLGIDYSDFITNQALYRGKFNTLVAKARTIRTLANYPFINAICAEFANIFKDCDSDTGREQLILPIKGFHHIYSPIGSAKHPGGTVRLMTLKDVYPSGGAATLFTAGSTNIRSYNAYGSTLLATRKFSYDLNILEKQIDALITDSDFNLIQADIEKAFGEQSGYMVIDTVDDSSTISPIYSGEFMEMFHNGVFHDLPTVFRSAGGINYITYGTYTNVICQAPTGVEGGLEHMLVNAVQLQQEIKDVVGGRLQLMGDGLRMLDSDKDSPDSNDIIIMTRYISNWENFSAPDSWDEEYTPVLPSNKYNKFKLSCGSNFICFGNMVTMIETQANMGTSTSNYYPWSNAIFITTAVTLINTLTQVANRPLFWVVDTQLESADRGYFVLNDINNIRIIKESELLPINESCFLSLWDLPSKTNI